MIARARELMGRSAAWFMRWRRRIVIGTAACATAVIAATIVYVAIPVPAADLAPPASPGVIVVDRNDVVLRSTRASDGAAMRWTPYGEIDADLINAFVATEDRRFWDHHGIDPLAVGRAAVTNVWRGRVVSGASTITMQLARLINPSRRGWTAKVSEALYALRLEAHSPKQALLEQYLNRVQLGQGTVGVAAAADLYFGATPSELSIGQAALLAGLAHAPSRDNPHVSHARARGARERALGRLLRTHLITREEVARARSEPTVAALRRSPFLAPHFTTRVLGWSASESTPRTVRTTLDAALQATVESEVRHTVDQLIDRGVAHAAAVVLDNQTGDVLAWVGSPDFWSSEDGQTDMVVSARQPGSALKPFLYGIALDRGYTAATILADIPSTYSTSTGPYNPRNYDRRFRGPVRVREALASSYNVPAVDMAQRIGPAVLLSTLHNAGFVSLRREASYYGLGLALGNGDVTLIELANGYRAIATAGVWHPWRWTPDAVSKSSRRVMSPVASAIVLDMLADPAARMPGFGLETPFDFPFPVAVKTGTSRHFTDNWAVGVTERFTVAVWAGNFSGKPMEGVSGVTGAGPLLHRVVLAAAVKVPPGALPSPAQFGAERIPVCRLSGLRATPRCTRLDEWFIAGTAPAGLDDWEQPGRVQLPAEFSAWSRSGVVTVAEPVAELAPAGNVAGARRASPEQPASGGFHILSPRDGDRYTVPPGVEARYATIALRVAGAAEQLAWKVDGRPFADARWTLTPGVHVFEAVTSAGDVARARIVVDP